MINPHNTHIENLSIHRVGNKKVETKLFFLSEQPFNLNDEIVPLMRIFL
jgi:hypothetical protein